MSMFTPTYSNPSDDMSITLCKILEAISLGSQNVTAGGNAFDVNIVPSIGNGYPGVKSITSGTAAGQNNLVQLKASAGVAGALVITNTNTSTDYFINLYDDANVTSGNIGTKTPIACFRAMKANTNICINLGPGINFVNGIAAAIVTAFNGSTLIGNTTGVDLSIAYL